MFEFVHCAGSTYYLRCFSNIGVYDPGDGNVILIDSGDHKKSVSDLDAALTERGWRVKLIVNTHAHGDHIVGNRFFKEKYGCSVYAPEIERILAEFSALEPTYQYLGVPTNRKRNFFFKPHGTHAELLTPDVLPEGFEIVPLPGHSMNMFGVKTPDNVWFLGDALLGEAAFEEYGLPLFYQVNSAIATARAIADFEGVCFVPAHVEAVRDIRELALYNAAALEERKALFLKLCGGKTFEKLFDDVSAALGLHFDIDRYSKVSLTAKCFLQALIDDGAITAHMEGSHLVYDVIAQP